MHDLLKNSLDLGHPLYKNFIDLGEPGTKTEQYKNFPIKTLLSREYSVQKVNQGVAKEGKRLVLENGELIEYPKGLSVSFDKTFEVDKEHFDSLYYFSHIVSFNTIYVEVESDISFEFEHICNGKDKLNIYRVLIETKPGVKVEVLERFSADESEGGFLFYGLDLQIAENATFVWIRDEKLKESLSIVGSHSYKVANHGALELRSFDLGEIDMLHLYKIDLDNYAWVDASHLLLGDENSKRGNVVFINHNEPYAKSKQEARTILSGKATGIFDAKICVVHDAQYASASQNSKAILLDTTAHMYAKPQLEIYTDELEASHGSTIGSLDEEALFYLRSRGVALKDARKILVSSFANTLIESVKNEKFFNRVSEDFHQSYDTKDLS